MEEWNFYSPPKDGKYRLVMFINENNQLDIKVYKCVNRWYNFKEIIAWKDIKS